VNVRDVVKNRSIPDGLFRNSLEDVVSSIGSTIQTGLSIQGALSAVLMSGDYGGLSPTKNDEGDEDDDRDNCARDRA
jgi:hypothetical protein